MGKALGYAFTEECAASSFDLRVYSFSMENRELAEHAAYVKNLEILVTARTEQLRTAVTSIEALVTALKKVQSAQDLKAAQSIADAALAALPD